MKDYDRSIRNTLIEVEAQLGKCSHVEDDASGDLLTYWDVIPGKINDPAGILTSPTSLYGGAAGIALFYLRLYQAEGREDALATARGGINYCISQYNGFESLINIGEGTLKGIPSGFLNGPAGAAYAAWLLYEESGVEKYRDFALRAANDLLASARADNERAFWTGTFGVISDGGLVLFLLFMYEKTGEQSFLDIAEKAGRFISETAEKPENGSGLRFAEMDTVAFGVGENGFFPGFFYGTAGTGYIFTKLYQASGKEKYLKLAEAAAEYIENIADTDRDRKSALVRYIDPYMPKLNYLGVCQGPAGTSRLFYQLYRITGEQKYLGWVIRLTNGIIQAGAPLIHSPGYWHTYNYCCGTAGLLEHFLDVYELTGDEKYYKAAEQAARKLVGDSSDTGGARGWYLAWNRHAPGEFENWNGLYIGNAGIASALLRYMNTVEGGRRLSPYLEDPYI